MRKLPSIGTVDSPEVGNSIIWYRVWWCHKEGLLPLWRDSFNNLTNLGTSNISTNSGKGVLFCFVQLECCYEMSMDVVMFDLRAWCSIRWQFVSCCRLNYDGLIVSFIAWCNFASICILPVRLWFLRLHVSLSSQCYWYILSMRSKVYFISYCKFSLFAPVTHGVITWHGYAYLYVGALLDVFVCIGMGTVERHRDIVPIYHH